MKKKLEKIFSKEQLISDMKSISSSWHEGILPGEDGNAGRTLEELLDVKENNLKIPDYGEFEIKSQRKTTDSLITLLHKEPNPAASIPKLINSMGWYNQKEKSWRFSSTTYSKYTIRGFIVEVTKNKIEFKFEPSQVKVAARDRTKLFNTYGEWLKDVEKRTPHYKKILPLHYDKDEFENHCVNKLNNILLALCDVAEVKGNNKKEIFQYKEAYIMQGLSKKKIKKLFDEKQLCIDINVSIKNDKLHNHGCGLRISQKNFFNLYESYDKIL